MITSSSLPIYDTSIIPVMTHKEKIWRNENAKGITVRTERMGNMCYWEEGGLIGKVI